MQDTSHVPIGDEAKQIFQDQGYLIFDTGIPDKLLDGVIADFHNYFGPGRRYPWGAAFADEGRILDGWPISDACLKIATWPGILDMLRSVYGHEAKPFQTLNFPVGTEQKPHSDSIHFNSEPFGLMCGVWTALEDIGPDQGPLVYYPGSHKLPEYNYEELGLVPDFSLYPEYEKRIENLIKANGFQPAHAIMKKGQAVLWAANLLHGGSLQRDKTKSRHSQVTHYYFAGAKAWRPAGSKGRRQYFEPDWIEERKVAKKRRAALMQRLTAGVQALLGMNAK